MRHTFRRTSPVFWILWCAVILLCVHSAVADDLVLLSESVRNRPVLYPREKDPFLAGLLSWFMMGVGQIYVQEYTKGSLFIAADLVDKASLILLISHINKKYSPDGTELIYINWRDFSPGTKVLILSYISISLGLRMYCVVDAYKSAQRYNERYFPMGKDKGLSMNIDAENISISYSIRLNK
jgi:hypothetical protein